MNNNPLGYSLDPFKYSRTPRVCLPCTERELFIKECANKSQSTIALRQKNRYIDEFLVYVKKEFKLTDPKKLTPDHFAAYLADMGKNKNLKESTRLSKLSHAAVWLKWLHKNGYLKQPIV